MGIELMILCGVCWFLALAAGITAYKDTNIDKKVRARILLATLFFGYLVPPVGIVFLIGAIPYYLTIKFVKVVREAEIPVPRLPKLRKAPALPSPGQLSIVESKGGELSTTDD